MATGPMVIVPSFVLWDYTFRPAGIFTKDKALCRGVRSEEVSVGILAEVESSVGTQQLVA